MLDNYEIVRMGLSEFELIHGAMMNVRLEGMGSA